MLMFYTIPFVIHFRGSEMVPELFHKLTPLYIYGPYHFLVRITCSYKVSLSLPFQKHKKHLSYNCIYKIVYFYLYTLERFDTAFLSHDKMSDVWPKLPSVISSVLFCFHFPNLGGFRMFLSHYSSLHVCQEGNPICERNMFITVYDICWLHTNMQQMKTTRVPVPVS